MEERFKVKSYVNAVTGAVRYRIFDVLDKGNPDNERPYNDKSAAEAARDLAYQNELHLYDGWNRALLRLNRELSVDSKGREIFVGLDRCESEKFIELSKHEPDDEFIDLELKRKIALTGIEDL